MPSSNKAIRIVSVSCCTLCPRLDGPSGHVNERANRSGITAVTLLIHFCKGFCLFPCIYSLRFRLCSITAHLFSSDKIASRSYSCLPLDLLCRMLRSRSISLDCSSFYHQPLRGPTDTSLPRLILIFFKGVASCPDGSRLVPDGSDLDDRTIWTTEPYGSNLNGRFDTAISPSSSAVLCTTVPPSSEVYLSLSGS